MDDTPVPPNAVYHDVDCLLDVLRRQTAELSDLHRALADAERRAAEAESKAGVLPELYDQLGKLTHQVIVDSKSAKKARAQLDPHMLPVAAMMRKVPPGIVRPQSVHDWCIDGVIDAKQIKGCWYATPESFWRKIEINPIHFFGEDQSSPPLEKWRRFLSGQYRWPAPLGWRRSPSC